MSLEFFTKKINTVARTASFQLSKSLYAFSERRTMNKYDLDQTIISLLNTYAKDLEEQLSACVLAYFGNIHPGYFRQFRDAVEEVREETAFKDRICILLRTGGGSAETAERMATVLREHFAEVSFLVPDAAMSAGTILCMSGDKIFMDYSSALGPIDPQVLSPDGSGYVAAMGYLDKVAEIVAKPNLSPADVVFLRGIDLGRLALFEQAKNFSVDLLKEWLVEFKFRNWTEHRTTNPGTEVTPEQKKHRAEEIAMALSNHKKWRSHGRALDLSKLRKLGLEIDDYSTNLALRNVVRSYNDPLSTYVDRMGVPMFMHNHKLYGGI